MAFEIIKLTYLLTYRHQWRELVVTAVPLVCWPRDEDREREREKRLYSPLCVCADVCLSFLLQSLADTLSHYRIQATVGHVTLCRQRQQTPAVRGNTAALKCAGGGRLAAVRTFFKFNAETCAFCYAVVPCSVTVRAAVLSIISRGWKMLFDSQPGRGQKSGEI